MAATFPSSVQRQLIPPVIPYHLINQKCSCDISSSYVCRHVKFYIANYYVRSYDGCGNRTAAEAIRNVLSHKIANSLAMKYNLSGRWAFKNNEFKQYLSAN